MKETRRPKSSAKASTAGLTVVRFWGEPMVAYRLYCVDGAGRFVASDLIEADTDSDALEIARGLEQRVACEVWDRDRLIGKIPAQSPAD